MKIGGRPKGFPFRHGQDRYRRGRPKGVDSVHRTCDLSINAAPLPCCAAHRRRAHRLLSPQEIERQQANVDYDALSEEELTQVIESLTKKLALCKATFQGKAAAEKAAISVHCVAGLGRAPVLVAVALIEAGVEPLDAVDRIRKVRRGAINARQLQYLENSYKRRGALKGSCAVV